MQINFSTQGIAPMQPMEPVPEGWYQVMIVDEEPKAVANKPQSWYLALTLEVIAAADGNPQFKGRKGYVNLNLGNDNIQAVEIAQRELSAICHVTGRHVIQDTAQLKGVPFQAKFVIDGNRNVIKGYKDMQGNDPGKTGGAAAPQTQQFQAPPAQQQPAQQFQQPAAQGNPFGAAAAPQQPAQGAWQQPAQAQQPAQTFQQPAQQPAQQFQQPAQQAAQQPQGGAPWANGAAAPQAPQQAAQAPAGGGAPWAQQQPAQAGGNTAPWATK